MHVGIETRPGHMALLAEWSRHSNWLERPKDGLPGPAKQQGSPWWNREFTLQPAKGSQGSEQVGHLHSLGSLCHQPARRGRHDCPSIAGVWQGSERGLLGQARVCLGRGQLQDGARSWRAPLRATGQAPLLTVGCRPVQWPCRVCSEACCALFPGKWGVGECPSQSG